MSESTSEDLKACNVCRIPQPLANYHVNKQQKGGLHPWCKTCRKASAARWAKANPEHARAGQARRSRKYKYGITGEEFDAMVTAQQGLCAICRFPPDGTWPTLLVDHDHKTGKVRALLCRNCNLALGYLRDDPAIHRRVVAYLKGGG